MRRQRLDQAIVERGILPSRTSAVDAIEARRVLVGGSLATKASRQVSAADPIVLTGESPRFVSRGGAKLQMAIDSFDVNVTGRSCVDAGSATGGFTDCLLQSGASRVLAIDVGYGQLHERLRQDSRVVSLERTNIRDVDRELAAANLQPSPPPSLVVADLSFTSVRPLAQGLVEIAGPEGELIILCKPQFEVGRVVAAKGKGVVRNRSDRHGALLDVIGALQASGTVIMGIVSSPILGPAGNAEFLVHASLAGENGATESMVERALDQAEAIE